MFRFRIFGAQLGGADFGDFEQRPIFCLVQQLSPFTMSVALDGQNGSKFTHWLAGLVVHYARAGGQNQILGDQ
jgi:hypothetical protein